MSIGNSVVSMVLRSPLHRMMSGSTDLIRYVGAKSGRSFSTPTQYAMRGDDVVILVARADTKTWWRNFRVERDLDVLVRGRWIPMTGQAVIGAEEPDVIAPLLDTYITRFPKVSRLLGGGTQGRDGSRRRRRSVPPPQHRRTDRPFVVVVRLSHDSRAKA